MLNFFLSILVHKKILTVDEAAHFSKELATRTHPQGFHDAHRIVEALWEDLKK